MPRKVFVIDTNVLISANLKPTSVSRQAYDKTLTIGLLVRSAKTLEEFARKIALAKFDKYLSAAEKTRAIVMYRYESMDVIVTEQIQASRDIKDNMFLELAVAAFADCIISGDKKHLLSLHPFRGIPILSPADFLKQF